MKRRNFLTAALGMLLLPFVKLPKVKPALTPWMPKIHPRQMAVFNGTEKLLITSARNSGKICARRDGYWELVPYQDVIRASQRSDTDCALRWKVMNAVSKS